MTKKLIDKASDYLGMVATIAGVAWVIAIIASELRILPSTPSGRAGLPSYLFFVTVAAGILSLGLYYFLGSGSNAAPSYVVIKGTSVFAAPGGTSAATRTLAPGMVVSLLSEEGAWSLIAKDGANLGYIATADLVPMS